jgi:transcriptional regulator GlxA family with amidase domain
MDVHRVVALALADVVAFDLSIPAQVFGHVEERGRYAFSVCGEHPGLVSSTTGFSITVADGLPALAEADTVVVPGFMPTNDPPPVVVDALRLAYRRGARIASVCVGAFALAAAGLMDGRAATTHWEHAADLRRRFPAVDVRPEVLYVDEGQVLSSAGISAGVDLCLHMVRSDFGADAAARVARRMVAALHRPGGQAQFMERPLPAEDSAIAATCVWAMAELEQRSLTVAELATRSGYSLRGFSRRFRDEVGMSPIRWLAAQRLLEARRLLERTTLSIEEVAARSGLGTPANLRLHFARELLTTPTAYRQAFRDSV